MKLVLFLCCIAALATALEPIRGTATVNIDFTGFSNDVSVSVCAGDHTYHSQGGAPRTYIVDTVNAVQPCQLVITEGGAATLPLTVQLSNGVVVNVVNHYANLTLHLENYNPAAVGNTFTVRLRADVNGQPNIFREYSDVVLPALASRVPTSVLGLPTNRSVTVRVLRTAQPVTVWVGENHVISPAAWTVCHTAHPFTTDANCADGTCDSGRCIAHLEAPFECDSPANWPFKVTDATLIWNPSATVQPRTVVRKYNSVAPNTYQWYVLALDDYQVQVDFPSRTAPTITRTSAATCYIGECEILPITSVLTVFIGSLTANITIAVNGSVFGTYPNINNVNNKFCVFNLIKTEVTANFVTGGTSFQGNINCERVNQTCNTWVFGTVTPNWGCLAPGSDIDGQRNYQIQVFQGNVQVYNSYGRPAASFDVPSSSGLVLRGSEGACPLIPLTPPQPKVTACSYADYPLTDCTAPPTGKGQCTSDRVGRVLSLFDLAYLPLETDVYLQNPDGGVFRYVPFQGDDPRCYCVFAVNLKAKIQECEAQWTSENTSCVVAQTGADDCSLCDFLSILEVDLVGLPRETGAVISVGPEFGNPIVILNESFNGPSWNGTNCTNLVNGGAATFDNPGWYNFYVHPQDNLVRLWRQGCNNAPANINGAGSGNTLQVGRMQGGVMANSTCHRFVVPDGASEITISFYAWQHGNGADDQIAYVRSRGLSSGIDVSSWIQVTPNAWTLNEHVLLLAQALETVELCFVGSMITGTQIDNVKVTAQAYPVVPCRNEPLVGNRVNHFVVLRSGAGTGLKQRYCITVVDGAASKTECVVCNGKTCAPETPFVCPLCLDLSSPNNVPGIENRLVVDITLGNGPSSFVRRIPSQGGTNGCAPQKRSAAEQEAERQYQLEEEEEERKMGLTRKNLRTMSGAEIKLRLKEVESRMASKRAQYDNLPDQQSRYNVLCIKYEVCISERTLGPLCIPVDCTPYGNCSGYNIVSLASIDLVCRGDPPAAGLLPQNGVDVTLYDTAATFDPRTGALIDNGNGRGQQIRGPRSQVVLDNTTCTWSPERWVGPSYQNVGNTLLQFPVLCLSFKVRIDEHALVYDRSVYPDPFQHPYKVATMDCNGQRFFSLPQGALLSEWYVRSLRGLPDNREAYIKFGDNSQNAIRFISGPLLRTPDYNRFCVVADNRPWYVFQWGTWSSRGPFLPFDSCQSFDNSLEPCQTSVTVPPITK